MAPRCACGRRPLGTNARRCVLCVTEAGLRHWSYRPALGYVSEQYEDERAWRARPCPAMPNPERRRAQWRAAQQRRRTRQEASHGR